MLLGLLAAVVRPGLVLAAVCLLAVCAIPLAFIDLAVRRLPDVLTGPAYAGPVLFLLLAAIDGGHWSGLGRALPGGAAFTGFCLLLFLISPGGFGPGDVKLATSLGTALAWFGWAAVLGGVLAGFLLAAVYSTGLLVSGRAARGQQIAFGPFMIAGAFLVILVAALRGFLPASPAEEKAAGQWRLVAHGHLNLNLRIRERAGQLVQEGSGVGRQWLAASSRPVA